MKFPKILEKLRHIWELWDLRSFLILSFSIQCMLILTASMRKRTSNRLIHASIGLAYLLADWAAYYAMGLIPSNDYINDLYAFWAPFFLLHLGGPTTITSYSAEDNELWSRGAFHLVVQGSMTIYIIYKSVDPHNHLLIPTLLMFLAAFIRYTERILALRSASIEEFCNSSMSDYGGGLTLPKRTSHTRLSEAEMVSDGYCLFQRYKRIFGGLPIKFDDHLKESKEYLRERSAAEAFTLVEIQLNLIYTIFYTKMWLIVEKMRGTVFSALSLTSELMALAIWVVVDTEAYPAVEVKLTNTLLIGAIAVDTVCIFKLMLSDLFIPRLRHIHYVDRVLNAVLSVRHNKLGRRLFGRWSGSISQFNLIKYVLEDGHKHRKKKNEVIKLMESMFGVGKEKVGQIELSNEMKERIFKHLKDIADYANTQGKSEEFFLKIGAFSRRILDWKELEEILSRAGHVEALLLWYLTTEIFYKNPERRKKDTHDQLSGYLMYLLVLQPMMIEEGVGFHVMFERMCEHLKNIYLEESSTSEFGVVITKENKDVASELDRVRNVSGDSTMRRVILNYAHYMAGFLKDLGDEITAKEIITDIWIELLCLVAIKCNERAHLNQLRNGGELLTLVWLMMTNFGLTINFEPQWDAASEPR